MEDEERGPSLRAALLRTETFADDGGEFDSSFLSRTYSIPESQQEPSSLRAQDPLNEEAPFIARNAPTTNVFGNRAYTV